MISPAAAHRAKVAGSVKQSVTRPVKTGNDAIIISQFEAERKRLQYIRSRIRRNEIKRVVLLDYRAWIDDFMQRETFTGRQAVNFSWMVVWYIDVGDYVSAVDMAAHAQKLGIDSVLDFSRTLTETVVEQIANGIHRIGEHQRHDALLDRLADLVAGRDMADQISAKLYKVRGWAKRESDPQQARCLFEKALELDSAAGVIRVLGKLIRAESKPDTKPSEKKRDLAKVYSLSARQAGAKIGVSAPTVIRHAKKFPDLLPHLCILMGTRKVYRFNSADLKRYKLKNLVRKK